MTPSPEKARELAETIIRKYCGYGYAAALSPEALEGISEIRLLLETALAEAFANGRLDAQYDNDTLPEQIEAYKRKARLDERGYWQEFIRLNKFEDHSECRSEERERCAKIAESINSDNGQYYGKMIAQAIRAQSHDIAPESEAERPEDK